MWPDALPQGQEPAGAEPPACPRGFLFPPQLPFEQKLQGFQFHFFCVHVIECVARPALVPRFGVAGGLSAKLDDCLLDPDFFIDIGGAIAAEHKQVFVRLHGGERRQILGQTARDIFVDELRPPFQVVLTLAEDVGQFPIGVGRMIDTQCGYGCEQKKEHTLVYRHSLQQSGCGVKMER